MSIQPPAADEASVSVISEAADPGPLDPAPPDPAPPDPGRVPAPDPTTFTVPVPRWRRFLDHIGITGTDVISRWRLNAEMASFVIEHTDEDGMIPARLAELVGYAKKMQAQDIDSGWTAFNAARREAITRSSGADLQSEAVGILAASKKKLTGWRAETVTALLSDDPDGVAVKPNIDAATVARAQTMIDEHNDNRYRQVAIHARSLRFLATLVVGVLGLLAVVVGFEWLNFLDGTAVGTLGSYVGVVTLGGIGSLLSVFTSRISGPDDNPITDMANRASGYVRPLLGALSAVIVVLVLESNVQTVVNFTGTGVYVGAILAGFSERLLGRTLEGLAE